VKASETSGGIIVSTAWLPKSKPLPYYQNIMLNSIESLPMRLDFFVKSKKLAIKFWYEFPSKR